MRAMTQLGAVIGAGEIPLWDCRDQFGASNHLVTNLAQAADLARALAQANLVLMRRHGATIVARDAPELAFRSIYSVRNAEVQYQASLLGTPDSLTEEETKLAGFFPPTTVQRAWDLWLRRSRCDRLDGAAKS
jgi:ribulose-5-phosphate 4-epimerase/fuculose-1-phosphate aldolase